MNNWNLLSINQYKELISIFKNFPNQNGITRSTAQNFKEIKIQNTDNKLDDRNPVIKFMKTLTPIRKCELLSIYKKPEVDPIQVSLNFE